MLKITPQCAKQIQAAFPSKAFIKEYILSVINNTDVYIDPKLLKRRPKKTVKAFERPDFKLTPFLLFFLVTYIHFTRGGFTVNLPFYPFRPSSFSSIFFFFLSFFLLQYSINFTSVLVVSRTRSAINNAHTSGVPCFYSTSRIPVFSLRIR